MRSWFRITFIKLKSFVDRILGFELFRVNTECFNALGISILHSPTPDGLKFIHWFLYTYVKDIKNWGAAYYKRPIRMTSKW